ncbi:MAG: hypothetical protein IIX63_05565, partial [Treponema sp.]|nr:hypothetical protein [Treponema sp.]
TYQEENDILLNKTYEEYFYNNWKKENEDSKSLELIFSPYCNLKCRYCYLHKYYDKQFPIETFSNENLAECCDLEGYKHDFLATNGFDVEGVDYDKELERMDSLD